jgi:hypothetical protein
MVAGCGATRIVSKPTPLARIGSSGVKPAGSVAAFHSRRDLHPPAVTTTAGTGIEGSGSADPGFLFLGPGPVSLNGSEQYGPLIVDRAGTPVWFRPLPAGLQVTNFARAEYRGKPALVWWEGKIEQSGYGQGEAVLLDQDYHELARVRAARAGRWTCTL